MHPYFLFNETIFSQHEIGTVALEKTYDVFQSSMIKQILGVLLDFVLPTFKKRHENEVPMYMNCREKNQYRMLKKKDNLNIFYQKFTDINVAKITNCSSTHLANTLPNRTSERF